MPLYEHVFLARQDASAQQVEDFTTQITGVIEGLGGKVTKTENWGVRSLTYRMNKNRKAHFVLLNIDAPSAAIAEIERQERISEDVIRYLSVRVEELEEGPSAMMRKADRDRELRPCLEDPGTRHLQGQVLRVADLDEPVQRRIVECRPPLAVIVGILGYPRFAGTQPARVELGRRRLEVGADHGAARQQTRLSCEDCRAAAKHGIPAL